MCERVGLGPRIEFAVCHGLGDAEVEHFDPTVAGDHHVRWFQVAVNDASLVSRHQRRAEGNCQGEKTIERESMLGQEFGQRLPLNQFHCQEQRVVGLLDGMQRHDVGMVERRNSFRFPDEAGAPYRIGGEGVREHFERHATIQPRVAREIDLAHATSANPLEDFVLGEKRTSRGRPVCREASAPLLYTDRRVRLNVRRKGPAGSPAAGRHSTKPQVHSGAARRTFPAAGSRRSAGPSRVFEALPTVPRNSAKSP